jgi:hypothetical protein
MEQIRNGYNAWHSAQNEPSYIGDEAPQRERPANRVATEPKHGERPGITSTATKSAGTLTISGATNN